MSVQIQAKIDKMQEEQDVDFIGIALSRINEKTNSRTIHWEYVSGNTNDHYQRIRLQIGKGIAGIVWRTGRSYQASELQLDPKKLLELPIARMEKIETAVAAPILKNGRVEGVLLFGYRRLVLTDAALLKRVEDNAAELLPLLKE